MPRVVSAGVPMRMPLGFIGGLVSKGMAFLFTVMPASPSAVSASLPSMPFAKTSTSIRCVSVPPEMMRKPSAGERLGERLGVGDDLRGVGAEARAASASPNATALAAMICTSGPPCWPGKTLLSTAAA